MNNSKANLHYNGVVTKDVTEISYEKSVAKLIEYISTDIQSAIIAHEDVDRLRKLASRLVSEVEEYIEVQYGLSEAYEIEPFDWNPFTI